MHLRHLRSKKTIRDLEIADDAEIFKIYFRRLEG